MRPTLARPALVAVTALAVVLLLLPGTGAAARTVSKDSDVTQAPATASLATSLATAGGTWADMPMGELGQPANTFWELFHQSGRTGRWSLVTPPGFADNGGIVTAVVGTRFVVGFGTSQLIHFSPMASSGDGGSSWSPGVLDEPLTTVPDAISALGASGGVAAMVGDPARAVDSGGSGLSRWSEAVSVKSIASSSAGRACGLTALTALAGGPMGELLLGGTCSRPDRVGIFEGSGHGWRLVTVELGTSPAVASSVLRLRSVDNGDVALVALGSTTGVRILGLRLDRTLRLVESVPLKLAAGERIISSAVSTNGGLDVLVTADGRLFGEVLAAGAHRWQQLPECPRDTAVISFDSRGGMDALVVDGNRFSAYVLAPRDTQWRRAEAINVPIQYGSSS